MKQLTFYTNWNNKLGCNIFTTMRLESNKYTIGELYNLKLKGVDIGVVEILDIKKFWLHDLKEWVALIDTGYNKDECIDLIKKMYSKYNIDFTKTKMQLMLCKKIK